MKNILTIVMLLLISNQICFAESDAYKAYLAKHAAASENNPTVVLDQNATPNESEIDSSAVVDVNSTTVANTPKSSKKIGATHTMGGGGVTGAAVSVILFGAAALYNSLVE
ncbi:MAG: hypothetical protein Q8T08_10590 [Ignavibacteria bacterium]|nr:hypothetical protein [Ignavibacteria bacterium]